MKKFWGWFGGWLVRSGVLDAALDAAGDVVVGKLSNGKKKKGP